MIMVVCGGVGVSGSRRCRTSPRRWQWPMTDASDWWGTADPRAPREARHERCPARVSPRSVAGHLDEWSLVGSGVADSSSSRSAVFDSRGNQVPPTPGRHDEEYRIDVYRWDERYVVAGDLTVDAEVRRILVQAVLSSLPPVRVSGVCRT